MAHRTVNYSKLLLWAYLSIWGSYFGYRGIEFLIKETATAEIRAISWRYPDPNQVNKKNRWAGSRRWTNDNNSFQCPETHFLYKSAPNDTGRWYEIWPQTMSFMEHKAGEKIAVIFRKGKPETAELYSLWEFWLAAPYITLLVMISGGVIMLYCILRYKPWELMH